MIVINTDDKFVGMGGGQSDIPVVMIKASDADALLAAGHSSALAKCNAQGKADHARALAERKRDSEQASLLQHRIHKISAQCKALEGLLARGTSGLKEARKRVTKALKDATEHHRIASTGGTSFAAVATALEGVVSADELDVVPRTKKVVG